ncbi:hypothetical protein WR25_02471 [Diploscapter pachys]|uniref:Response regulatory domain-containing protein n=1 Tax=Diploscapter pachys TaxID=2018661 RepID=A0A2A2K6B3_9BILA|nr:hypothetical protein WR25_02471 [Diploscapter pachys]
MFIERRPQLVLLDALMPVMDGFEAARRIKALAGEALVPIIFLTSLNEEEAFTPSGDMHVLLGDFTGHGLPAAVGAMPLAEVFYGMTAKGYGLAETLREMNAKLKRILPVDMFCCALLLSLSFQRGTVEVWDGGMPDGYRLSAEGEVLGMLCSHHLPLGVLAPEQFDDATQVLPLAVGERLFLLSDGVVDTGDAQERLFGVDRLRDVLADNRNPDLLFDEVMQALAVFGGQSRDDISLCDIRMSAPEELAPQPVVYSDSGRSSPLDWSLRKFTGSGLAAGACTVS